MNREEARELAPIMQAYADGADVEYLDRCGAWFGATTPTFAQGTEFRVKPKPLECWVWFDADGKAYGARPFPPWDNLEEPAPREGATALRMVEPS